MRCDYRSNTVYCLFVCFLLIFFGACSGYDDQTINDLKIRVTRLEQLCSQLNTNITSLQVLVSATENADMVTGINPVYEGSQLIGYSITFSKSNPITIYHGKDGKDGQDGKDGTNPVIGVAKDKEDNQWYWTINGEWLLNPDNEKILAIGIGVNGADGKDGKDAVAPQLRISEDGYWYISTDGGANWTMLVKATGEPGKDGDSMFENVYTNDNYAFFVLTGGGVIKLPLLLPEVVEEYESIGNADFWLLDGSSYSDHIWVENRFIGFMGSSDDLNTNAGWIDIHVFDNGYVENGNRKARTARYRLNHFWGHCNTIDYNKGNDCLILGNGSGDYRLTGRIIIIPSFSSVVNVTDSNSIPLSLSDVNALVIDCSDYNLGSKFNLVWGDDNDRNYNVAYLITANLNCGGSNGGDLETIRKIVLRKGEETGQYGAVVNNATPFNGSFDIVETYYQKTAGYENCDQGTCYYNGEIYAAIGHDGAWLWRMRMSGDRIFRKDYKQHSYHDYVYANYGNSTGVCIRDGYLFLGRYGLGVMAIKL